MKTILLLLLVANSALGQINLTGHTTRAQQAERDARETKLRKEKEQKHQADALGTNVIRVVNGKVYHIGKSTNWVTLPVTCRNYLVVDSVDRAGIVCAERSTGAQGGHVRYLLIRNHPLQSTAVTGIHLEPVRAMPVGRTNVLGETIAVYDYGTLPSHLLNSGPAAETPRLIPFPMLFTRARSDAPKSGSAAAL